MQRSRTRPDISHVAYSSTALCTHPASGSSSLEQTLGAALRSRSSEAVFSEAAADSIFRSSEWFFRGLLASSKSRNNTDCRLVLVHLSELGGALSLEEIYQTSCAGGLWRYAEVFLV